MYEFLSALLAEQIHTKQTDETRRKLKIKTDEHPAPAFVIPRKRLR